MILAGGFGTRLAHIVPGAPKPMAPVAGRPFLRYILDMLAERRFWHAIIADGYMREQIEDAFGDGYRGIRIEYSPEDEPLLTGGAAKRALSLCTSERVFVLNGDTYLDCDFDSMEDALSDDALAVIAVREVADAARYGTVEVAAGGRIASFLEKGAASRGLVSAGVYLMDRLMLEGRPDAFSLEGLFEELAPGGALRACECGGAFIDIGVPDDYARAQRMMEPLARGCRLAIFDRDGTINEDTGHPHRPEDLRLIPETLEVMRRYAQDPAWKVVVATNQAGIAKGLYAEGDMRAFHDALDEMLEEQGCRVDAYYFCPHHPDITGPCACRKPAPGMLLEAMADFDAEPAGCILYGDKQTDMEAAAAAGVEGVLIFSKEGIS